MSSQQLGEHLYVATGVIQTLLNDLADDYGIPREPAWGPRWRHLAYEAVRRGDVTLAHLEGVVD
jgi:hypothetical protein